MHNKNTNHYSNLFSKVNDLLINWFPDYVEKYISGDVFDIDKSSFLVDPLGANIWNINSVEDTLNLFSYNAPDLSAKRLIIELNHEFDDESAKLLLDAYPSNSTNSEGLAILAYSVDGNKNLQHLITTKAQSIEIANLKQYYQNGTRKFLIVIVNCINNGVDYTGKTEMECLAKIEQESYNRCSFYYNVSNSIR